MMFRTNPYYRKWFIVVFMVGFNSASTGSIIPLAWQWNELASFYCIKYRISCFYFCCISCLFILLKILISLSRSCFCFFSPCISVWHIKYYKGGDAIMLHLPFILCDSSAIIEILSHLLSARVAEATLVVECPVVRTRAFLDLGRRLLPGRWQVERILLRLSIPLIERKFELFLIHWISSSGTHPSSL